MLSSANNRAVSLSTRSWLGTISHTETILDVSCWDLVQPILEKTAAVHPGGLVFGLCHDLHVSYQRSLTAASVCEMFYSGCSVTDDLQDDDTDDYLGHMPISLRLNAQLQLLCLVAERLAQLVEEVGGSCGKDLVAQVYRTLSIMLTGQRKEIVRDPWNVDTYESVARLSAGEQFALYLRIAAFCAEKPLSRFDAVGNAMGTFLQIITDKETGDPRFTELPEAHTEALLEAIILELKEAARGCDNGFVLHETEELLRRCPILLPAS